MFLFIAVLSGLALFAGGAVFAYSMTPTLRGLDPVEPTPPSPPEVTLADVMTTLDAPSTLEHEAVAGRSFATAELASGLDEADERSREFASLAGRLGSYFDTTRYPWLSETRVECTYRSYYGCLNWEEKTVRKGVVEIVNEALKRRDTEAQNALLRALVDVMPLCADEDTRFVGVGAVIDVVNAVGGVDATVMAAFRGMLAPPPAPADATVGASAAPLSASLATDYLTGVLRARKRGASPTLLAVWLGRVPELHRVFGNDADGASNRVDGLVATWQALEGTLPELAGQRVAGIEAIASQAPEARRPEVVRAYGEIVRDRAAEAGRAYEAALAEREATIARLDAEVAEKKAEKDVLRGTATSVAGSAFALLAGVGLLLALLAVERNTRALREVLAALETKNRAA
ncbi:MAG: hypothetical protein ACK4YP_01605 [Myxococcota bacterium]